MSGGGYGDQGRSQSQYQGNPYERRPSPMGMGGGQGPGMGWMGAPGAPRTGGDDVYNAPPPQNGGPTEGMAPPPDTMNKPAFLPTMGASRESMLGRQGQQQDYGNAAPQYQGGGAANSLFQMLANYRMPGAAAPGASYQPASMSGLLSGSQDKPGQVPTPRPPSAPPAPPGWPGGSWYGVGDPQAPYYPGAQHGALTGTPNATPIGQTPDGQPYHDPRYNFRAQARRNAGIPYADRYYPAG